MLKKLEALKNEINDQQTKEDGEDSENGGRESKNASKLSHHAPAHPQEELSKTQTRNKFGVKPDQHAVFNGIDRENPLLMKRYYKNDCNISAIYNPDYTKTRAKYNSNYAYIDPITYEIPKEKVYRIP